MKSDDVNMISLIKAINKLTCAINLMNPEIQKKKITPLINNDKELNEILEQVIEYKQRRRKEAEGTRKEVQ